MKVLVGCERSGIVREAFRAKGHDAVSCDLVDAEDGSLNHIKGNILDNLAGWDLGIFFPDRTYLTVSGLHWNKKDPTRSAKTDMALAFVSLLLSAPIPKIALENPVGCISTRYRKPDQIIQPYQFGHDASKKTCLWLKNLAKLPLDPGKYVYPKLVCSSCGVTIQAPGFFGVYTCNNCGSDHPKKRWANQTDSGQNRLGPSPTRAMDRSRTYSGIAESMANTWG